MRRALCSKYTKKIYLYKLTASPMNKHQSLMGKKFNEKERKKI